MKILAIIFILASIISTNIIAAKEPTYSVESLAGIIQELSKDKHEQTVKDWLAKNRPEQFERLFGEKKDEPKEAEKEEKGLFSILADLSAAIADPQIAMLDYYINSKASAGWEVISLTDTVILFRRSTQNPGEQDGGENPSALPEPE